MTKVGRWIWDHRVALALTTWGPLVLQLAFPWIYFFGRPWPRRIVLLLAMSFHVGILVLMGLSTFALIMIGAELLLLSDGDVEALVGIWRRVRPRPAGEKLTDSHGIDLRGSKTTSPQESPLIDRDAAERVALASG